MSTSITGSRPQHPAKMLALVNTIEHSLELPENM